MRHTAARLTLLLSFGSLFAPTWGSRACAQSPVVVRGAVYDSLISNAPLSGAEVWVEGTTTTARTDAAGRFELPALPVGRYRLTFYHPILDSTGLSAPPTQVDVAAGLPADVLLATPGPEAAHRTLCPHDPWRAAGAILALVRDATDGKALGDVQVTAEWTVYVVGQAAVRGEPRVTVGHTDASGRVLLCNVPTDVEVVLHGRTGVGPLGSVLVDLHGRAFRHAHLHLAPALASGRVTGVVRTRNGDGVPGANVVAIGTNSRAVTDERGGFTLPEVAAGSRIIEASAIGYPPTRAQIEIPPQGTEHVDLMVGDSIAFLDPVTVSARYEPYLTRVGFSLRRRTAVGHFLDTTDVQRAGAVRFEEVFRMVPGVRLRPSGSGYLVELQRGEGQITNPVLSNYCAPLYFIDGVYYRLPPMQTPSVDVAPEEVLAIEVYSNLTNAPPQYQRLDSGCGVILIWTKRGVPKTRR
ncbi:MAG TPA: carboxypeptidase regulatory-like domain-containing protein [Gemmatimonadales bacterium]|nr:carboxypeptidase regulatory-like domain-containing protein [Gemmatimonadales bacterium]